MARQAVLFDLDDTLHDRRQGLRAFIRHQFADQGLDRYGIDETAWLNEFLRLEQNGKVWKDIAYRELCNRFSCPVKPDDLLEQYIQRFAQHVVPSPEMLDVLNTLRSRGWRVGIVTNGPSEFQERTLEALGLPSAVDAIVISASVGLRKPQREIFELTLKQLGAQAQNSWMVGDDPINDIVGGHGAGLQTAWSRMPDMPRPNSDAVIEQLSELLPLVGSLK